MRSVLLAIALAIVSSTAPTARGAQIRAFANRWLGTPYQWGGNSKQGIDCSAYLREMFRDLFNVELPRTTRQQIDLGIDLSLNKTAPGDGLEPGDLIFYIDSSATPNHVVVYMGGNTITHSVSGRGVVVEPIRKVFGRKIVARRLLVPSSDGSGHFGPIPPAGPIVVQDIPCPADYQAKRFEIRTYAAKPINDMKQLGDRDICDFRALAEALRAKGGEVAEENARKLDAHAEWLQSIDALKGTIGRGW
jgi:hypothetical protein